MVKKYGSTNYGTAEENGIELNGIRGNEGVGERVQGLTGSAGEQNWECIQYKSNMNTMIEPLVHHN